MGIAVDLAVVDERLACGAHALINGIMSNKTEQLSTNPETDFIDAGALSTSAIEGGEVEVTVEARLRVENGDGEALARETASDSATVSVESGSVDPDEYGSVGGSGELRIEKA